MDLIQLLSMFLRTKNMLLKEKKMVELNRRTFLSGSVAAGAVALFGTEAAHAAGASSFPQNGMKRLMSSLLVLVLQALLQLLKPRRLVLL